MFAPVADQFRALAKGYLSEQFEALLHHPDFEIFLYGNIRGPDGRAEIVHGRVKALAGIK